MKGCWKGVFSIKVNRGACRVNCWQRMATYLNIFMFGKVVGYISGLL